MSSCRRRRSGQFWSAARRWRPKNIFTKILEKISFYPKNFPMTLFSHRKLQQNRYAARSNNNIGGAPTYYRQRRPINKTRRRRPQIVSGGSTAAAQCGVGGGGARLYSRRERCHGKT